jgi:putative CocE/NonD family hydrolase
MGRGIGDALGAIPFGSNTAEYFREKIQAPFFAYYLKDKGKKDFPQAVTFESGANEWRRWDQWPPTRQTETRALMFGAREQLTLGAQGSGIGDQGFDEYVSDPAHPVPYRQRPIQPTYFPGGSKWSTWLVEDQRFVDDRADVLSWETPPLTADVTIAGEIVATLFASTTGTDADWIVKLIDVYPENHPSNWNLAGYQLMVSNEVFRGRYRDGFEKPKPIEPNKVLEYTWSLHTQNYTFKTGHRIMVQVQSTWFPIIDRNPQTFVPNIFEAEGSDFKARRTAFIGRRSTLRASTCRSFAGDELAQLDVFAHHHQRLGGVVEDAEEIAGVVLRVDVLAVDVERDGTAAFDRVVEPRLEARLETCSSLRIRATVKPLRRRSDSTISSSSSIGV